jgi:hypothetical protein
MKLPGPFLEVVPGPSGADLEVERVLGIVRGMADPDLGNRERVAAALRLALPPPSASAIVQRVALEHAQPVPLQPLKLQPLASESRVVRTALPWVVLGGALIGVLGFWLGQSAGHAAGRRELLSEQTTAIVTPLSEAPAAAALAVAALPSTADSERPAPRGEGPARRARAARPAKHSEPHALSLAQPSLAALSFREVLEQLRRARRQLDSGQPTASLILLSELDRGAGEILREEREVTRVLSLCGAGQNEAARRAAALLSSASPRSIYAMRLARSCVSGADRND